MTGRPFTAGPVDFTIDEPDIIKQAGIELTVLHTPGHTPGGISLYSAEEGIVFVPHGYLHYVPFLAFKDGDGKYLLEKFRTCFVQSASSLKFLKEGKGLGVLVVGNPTEDLIFGEEEVQKAEG